MVTVNLSGAELANIINLVIEEIETLSFQLNEEAEFLREEGLYEEVLDTKVFLQELYYKLDTAIFQG